MIKNSQDKSDDIILQEAIRLIDEGVSVTLPVDGSSMLPFIVGGRESVILKRPEDVWMGAVVFAWVDNSRYVIHRIIKIDKEHVVLMGDGNLVGTEHCNISDVKAVATHVVDRTEKIHYLYNRWRRLAARVWLLLRPIRRYLLAIYRRL